MADSTETSVPEAAKGYKITLYWLNQSRAQRIVWLLEELHVPYEIKVFHRQTDMLAPPELKKIHPLGKSPVVEISGPGLNEPLVLAESGSLVEYLVDHFGPHLRPQQWQAGKEGQVGGETPEFLRYRYYMHYPEGSLMPPLVIQLIPERLKTAPVPFFLKPLMRAIGDRMTPQVRPFAMQHLDFVEEELGTAPGGGPYMCGAKLTAADILLSFPLQASRKRLGATEQKYPRLNKYVDLLESEDGFKRGVKKIEEVEGKPLEDFNL